MDLGDFCDHALQKLGERGNALFTKECLSQTPSLIRNSHVHFLTFHLKWIRYTASHDKIH